MYKNVIFDLDGTLLNTLEDLADATNWVCAQHGWPAHQVEEYKYFVGNGAPKLLERVVPAGVPITDELRRVTLEEFTRRYNGHKSDKTTAYPGVPEVIRRLKQAGVTLAVLSNKPHEAARPVVERYYPGLFHKIQGALPGLPVKPDPTLLHRLMEQLGATPADTLFVGDSSVDIRTAKNGGLTSCGVLWGFRTRQELEAEGADYIVDSAQALVELILG
ncbi:MAG: HAD family hydrolase [Lawsonibacter sp.]|nr:HAD family hydrolase [Lawsonibacter sp.]